MPIFIFFVYENLYFQILGRNDVAYGHISFLIFFYPSHLRSTSFVIDIFFTTSILKTFIDITMMPNFWQLDTNITK